MMFTSGQTRRFDELYIFVCFLNLNLHGNLNVSYCRISRTKLSAVDSKHGLHGSCVVD